MSDMIYNALRTPDGTVIESLYRHDYQSHIDANGKKYMIDGGLDYVRCSAWGDEEHLTVTLEDEHEKVREVLTWGTYGINGDQPLKQVKLSEMNTAHIQACIDTQDTMYPQIKSAMNTELQYRADICTALDILKNEGLTDGSNI